MSLRRLVIIFILGAAVALPILIGASCPQPSSPILSFGSIPATVSTSVPPCIQGFICISIVNAAYVDVEVALYVHDGFDPQFTFPWCRSTACCPNPSSATTPCSCPRPGWQVGEMMLSRPELFGLPKRYHIFGANDLNVLTLKSRGLVLIQIQEGDIKSFGITTGLTGSLPVNPAIKQGPYYRCPMVAVSYEGGPCGGGAHPAEDIPSGQTFQFLIKDQLDGEMPGTAQLVVLTGKSSSGPCPTVK